MKKSVQIQYKSHMEYSDIEVTKLYHIGKSLKYKHPIYKKFDLIVKLPVFKLDKYPVFNESFFNPNNLGVKLKLQLETDSKESFDNFIKSTIKHLSNNKGSVYPDFTTSNTFSIKSMEKYNYPVYWVEENKSGKLFVKPNSPKSVPELKELFKSDYQVLPFVQMKYVKVNNNNFLTFTPVKFYVGKNLSQNIINKLVKQSTPIIEAPKSEHFNANQFAVNVTDEDFNKYFEDFNKYDELYDKEAVSKIDIVLDC